MGRRGKGAAHDKLVCPSDRPARHGLSTGSRHLAWRQRPCQLGHGHGDAGRHHCAAAASRHPALRRQRRDRRPTFGRKLLPCVWGLQFAFDSERAGGHGVRWHRGFHMAAGVRGRDLCDSKRGRRPASPTSSRRTLAAPPTSPRPRHRAPTTSACGRRIMRDQRNLQRSGRHDRGCHRARWHHAGCTGAEHADRQRQHRKPVVVRGQRMRPLVTP